MIKKLKPTPTELVILKTLWKNSPMSAKEVHENVSNKLSWSSSSTRKTIDRMVEKKYLKIQNFHGINIYSPIVEKIQVLAEFVSDLTQRVMEVETPLPISMFTDSKLLNEDELEQLESYINTEFKNYD